MKKDPAKREKVKKKAHGFWNDFRTFINNGNVVDMAIGVVVATAFKDIVTKFTSAFISPIVALITGGVNLSDQKIVVRPEVLDEAGEVLTAEVALTWGALAQSIIDFLIIAFVLFLIIRVFTRATNAARELAVSKEEKEASERAAAEKAAAEKAAAEAAEAARLAAEAEVAAEKARDTETVALLREIRDALSKK